jgi:nucleotidyltransferase/DNA polymerase involved in DNA repair
LLRIRGELPGSVEPERERMQISTESTFAEDIGDSEDRLHEILARMTMKLGATLRKREQWAGTLAIKLRVSGFHDAHAAGSRSIRRPERRPGD